MVGIFDMKRITITFLIGIFFLSACGGTASLPPTAIATVSDSFTSTPSPAATATQTPLPSSTPTSSITPLPTIPTFTPTFDVSTIVTVTPAPKAECPKENPNLVINLHLQETRACTQRSNKSPLDCINRNIQKDILDYLNQGGNINSIISQLEADGQKENVAFAYKDVTNDSVTDFLFRDINSPYDGYHVYICNNGTYKTESILDGDPFAYLLKIKTIQDLNGNNIQDIVVTIGNVLIIYDWNGNSFTELLGIRDFGESTYKIQDVDNNGIYEIILFRGTPPFWDIVSELPWRDYTSVYSWNGSSYVVSSKKFTSPVYRFQAIQDGDDASAQKEYDKALSLYQAAIFSDKLKSYSSEIRDNLRANLETQFGPSPLPTLTPYPSDLSEYPRLAAYAYFRIVLLHLVQNHESEAITVYNTLQQKFGSDPYGHSYVEMATAFWEAYQSTHKVYDGCAAAIQYAADHPEILTPLGSDYHGSQSQIYVPEDVCPFR